MVTHSFSLVKMVRFSIGNSMYVYVYVIAVSSSTAGLFNIHVQSPDPLGRRTAECHALGIFSPSALLAHPKFLPSNS